MSCHNDCLRRELAGTDNDATRPALRHFIVVLLFGITQIRGACILQAGYGGNDGKAIAVKLAANMIGNLLSGSFHAFLPRKSATAWAVRSPCSMHAGTDMPSR